MKGDELTIKMGDSGLSVPGWRLTPTGATLAGKASAEVFRNAFKFLHATTGYNAWWWGDVILAYCEFEKKEEGAWVHYAHEWEEIVGLSAGTLHSYCAVARAFKSTSRLADLSWSHHDEIVHAGIKDPHEMQDWLAQALVNKWSKTTLRAQLRAHKAAKAAGSDEGGEQPVKVTQQELFAFKRWVRLQHPRIPDMDERERRAMLAELTPVLRFASDLAASLGMAALPSPAATGTPGAKESLPAAS